MHIYLQPRGLGEAELLAKVNEVINKFNNQAKRIAALEEAAKPADNTSLIQAIEQAELALAKAKALFEAQSKEVK